MFELRCTVRNCQQLLKLEGDGLHCSAGHHFDRSKQGYWNLLQPQDRKSAKPGDSDEAVIARRSWLNRGHMAGLIETLKPWISSQDQRTPLPCRTIDLGCGEGTLGAALFPNEASGYCGIDLSKRAIKLAGQRWPDATWVLANADRGIPAADASVHRVISLFGRRPVTEIHRVLLSGGICIVAVPAEEDLIELREEVQQSGNRRSRWELVVEAMANAGLSCLEQKQWEHRVELQPDAIAEALSMTYRAGRHSQQQRLESLTAMQVTLAADLMLFRK